MSQFVVFFPCFVSHGTRFVGVYDWVSVCVYCSFTNLSCEFKAPEPVVSSLLP